MIDRAAHAASFGAAAAAYERSRPEYPAGALSWLLPDAPAPEHVVDLGAGTGKLTRALVGRGFDVTAVEPSQGMREQLVRAVPRARALAGSAESLPLPDASADALLVAQAWHWVDTDQAVPEAARVLRPGGSVGLLWNDRDERHPWVAELGRLLDSAGGVPTAGVGVDGFAARPDLFGPVEQRTHEWTLAMTPDQVVELVESRSYVIVLPEAERTALLAEVRALLANHPDLAGGERVEMAYLTHSFRIPRLA
jgi:SAM-dependent methyltransferase